MIYYLIRHKASGEFMPQAKKSRGYSHWNPSNVNGHGMQQALPIPRLIDTRRKAAKCIKEWVCNPNAKHTFTVSYEGHEDDSLDIKPDGRTKNDLEVVEVELVIRGE